MGARSWCRSPTADAGAVPNGATLRSLGPHRLKDIDSEVLILQLCHPELQSEFPALRSAAPPVGALPSFASSFVGRSREREELAALVREHRLLTIVGPPGIGKTRLAIELGRDVAAELRAGIRIVEVAAVHSRVAEQIARGLGVPTQGDQPAEAALVQHLASGDSLLIIDNCEHVLAEVAALVHQIMSGCPQVRLVLTSREPLEVVGETVWQLFPLAEAAELFVAAGSRCRTGRRAQPRRSGRDCDLFPARRVTPRDRARGRASPSEERQRDRSRTSRPVVAPRSVVAERGRSALDASRCGQLELSASSRLRKQRCWIASPSSTAPSTRTRWRQLQECRTRETSSSGSSTSRW